MRVGAVQCQSAAFRAGRQIVPPKQEIGPITSADTARSALQRLIYTTAGGYGLGVFRRQRRSEPNQVHDTCVRHPVVRLATVSPKGHIPAIRKARQVARHPALRELERLDALPHASFALQQQLQDSQSARIAKCTKELCYQPLSLQIPRQKW